MEPDIAPLAKRLAEENNVNWRQLEGSGPSGRVVERDVLEYLARVMAGEEDTDPTPEPLPEGMGQWPGQDMPRPPASRFNDFDEAGFDEPETSLARNATPHVESSLSAEVEPSLDEPVIDEEIFLFDDEDADPSVAAVPDVWDGSKDGWGGVAQAAPDISALTAPVHDGPDSVGIEPDEVIPLAHDEDDWRLLVERDKDDLVWAEADGGTVEVEAAPDVVAVEPFAAVPLARDEDDWRAQLERDEEWVEPDGGKVELEAVQDHVAAEPAEVVLGAQAEGGWSEWAERDSQLWDDPDSDSLGLKANEQVVAEEPLSPEIFVPVPVPPAPVLVSGALPLVSYGVLLRRHIKLTALAEAQRAAGRELADGAPIPPTAFLLRAAAKALRREPLGPDRSVALAVLSKRGLGARRLDKAEVLSFRELVAAVNEAMASETTELEPAALLVADLSEFALDEAVLRADIPVLTLGRVLYDSQEGGYHSTLSLSGEFVAAVGAKLLGEVALLLDSPVQLVL